MIISDDVIWFDTLADTLVPFSLSDGTAIGETLESYNLMADFKNVERKSLLASGSRSNPYCLFRRVEDKLVKYELNYELNVERDDERLISEYPSISYSGDYI